MFITSRVGNLKKIGIYFIDLSHLHLNKKCVSTYFSLRDRTLSEIEH